MPEPLPLSFVDLDATDEAPPPGPTLDADVPVIVIGVSPTTEARHHSSAVTCDVVLAPDSPELAAALATIATAPIASQAMARLLRHAEGRSLDDALLAESATYSALQAGPEFAAWRAGRAPRARPIESHAVTVERVGSTLHVILDRPTVGNALNRMMRDELVEALGLPVVDPSITDVRLDGAGPSFCTGGDLDEFGTFPDPATAHLVRLERSPARAIASIAPLTVAHVHGACIGSGIELAAFAGHVVAAPDTFAQLPELSLGLVPGAGGTYSLTRRIGRHRTMRMALTGERIDAATALAWGLVDAVTT